MEGPEVFYRAMSQSHANELAATGRLPATGETFISPTQAFAEGFEGVLVRFELRAGTTARLAEVGVRDASAAAAAAHPEMAVVDSGWTAANAFFKGESGQVNIGLGRGRALDIFNESMVTYEVIRP